MDERYVIARRVLLDALEALGEHREATILVGAQAIYLHAGCTATSSASAVGKPTPTCTTVLDSLSCSVFPVEQRVELPVGAIGENRRNGDSFGQELVEYGLAEPNVPLAVEPFLDLMRQRCDGIGGERVHPFKRREIRR